MWFDTKNAESLRKAESGYMLQVLAERWLADKAQLSRKQLGSAWINMDQKAKVRIEQWAVALDHDPETHDVAYLSFIVALGASVHLPTVAYLHPGPSSSGSLRTPILIGARRAPSVLAYAFPRIARRMPSKPAGPAKKGKIGTGMAVIKATTRAFMTAESPSSPYHAL